MIETCCRYLIPSVALQKLLLLRIKPNSSFNLGLGISRTDPPVSEIETRAEALHFSIGFTEANCLDWS